MNPLAKENPFICEMLSKRGKELFFPKGVLSQSTEAKAKAKKFNATIGIATEDGVAMHLPCIRKHLGTLKPNDAWTYYPFNSGYFMCLKLKKVNAETLRQHILNQYGIGVISIGDTDIRVAFSCIEVDDVKELFDLTYQGIKDLS